MQTGAYPRTSSLGADEEALDGKYHKRPRRRWSESGSGSLPSPLVLIVLLLVGGVAVYFAFAGQFGSHGELSSDNGEVHGADEVEIAVGKRKGGKAHKAAKAPPSKVAPKKDRAAGSEKLRPAQGNEGDDSMDATPLEDDASLGPVRSNDASPLPRQLTEHPYTFTLVNMATEQKTWLQRSLLNKQRYARKHGISWELHLETLADSDPVWSKIPAMELALFGVSSVPNLDLDVPPGHADWTSKTPVQMVKGARDHWAWWLDIDTLVTNYSVSLTSVVDQAHVVFNEEHKGKENPPEMEMILSRDCNGINAGSLFLRRSPWVQRFLPLLYSIRDELPNLDPDKRSEQDAIVYLYERKKEIRDRTTFLPQSLLNGNPDDIGCTEFFKDDSSGRTWKVGLCRFPCFGPVLTICPIILRVFSCNDIRKETLSGTSRDPGPTRTTLWSATGSKPGLPRRSASKRASSCLISIGRRWSSSLMLFRRARRVVKRGGARLSVCGR